MVSAGQDAHRQIGDAGVAFPHVGPLDQIAVRAADQQRGRLDALHVGEGLRLAQIRGRHEPQPGIGAPDEALTQLLIHVRRTLVNHPTLSLDYPAGEMTDAILAAGFKPRRTLIWMRA